MQSLTSVPLVLVVASAIRTSGLKASIESGVPAAMSELMGEVIVFLRWLGGVSRKYLEASRTLFIGLIIAQVAQIGGKLVAFMLPLKIILLAASPSVPDYLGFIHPAQKVSWLVGLVVLYLLNHAAIHTADRLVERWSSALGTLVITRANDLPVKSSDHEMSRKACVDFTGVYASSFFVCCVAVALLWIHPVLLASLIGMVLLFPIFCRLRPRLQDQRSSIHLISTWEQLAFAVTFLVILWPFALNGQGDLLPAAIGFILVRRLIGELTRMMRSAVLLSAKREVLNALIYYTQAAPAEASDRGGFNTYADFFESRRHALFASAWGVPSDAMESFWAEPGPGATKHCAMMDGSGHPRHAEAQIFPESARVFASHEAFLFRHVDRHSLLAPELIAQLEIDAYCVFIKKAGNGLCPTIKRWHSLRSEIERQVMGQIPPAPLVESFRRTHRTIAERLSEPFRRRLEVFVDSSALGDDWLDLWDEIRPVLCANLKNQPLAIYNPDLGRTAVRLTSAPRPGLPLVMQWGRWTLEPIGAVIARADPRLSGAEWLESISRARGDLSDRRWDGDLELGALAAGLEQALRGERRDATVQVLNQLFERLGRR